MVHMEEDPHILVEALRIVVVSLAWDNLAGHFLLQAPPPILRR